MFANLRFQHIFSYALIAHLFIIFFYGIRDLLRLFLVFVLMILRQLNLDLMLNNIIMGGSALIQVC